MPSISDNHDNFQVSDSRTATRKQVRQALPRTITELIEIRAAEDPTLPIISYPFAGTEYVDYTYRQLREYSQNAAASLAESLPARETLPRSEGVVAMLGPSNIDYLINLLALSRLGFAVLLLSPRLATPAYLSLLETCKCNNLVFHPSIEKTARNLSDRLNSLSLHPLAAKENYNEVRNVSVAERDQRQETSELCWIIHSSGSTGLPKPIYQTHNAALRNYENNMNMKGFVTLPLFHNHGISCVFRALTSKKQIHMYNADLPLTTAALVSIMEQHEFQIFYGVPYALKLLAEDNTGIQKLRQMQVVMFGGSACPDALGDKLVDNGVNLVGHYGSTEVGQLMTSFRPGCDKAWNYVREFDALSPYLRWESQGGNIFELVVLSGWPSKVATNRDDGAYALKDLFEPHPTIPRAWKYVGRLDDTIVLVNGEKHIPIAMEQAVRNCPLVKDVVMFGAGKPMVGMFVISAESAKDASDAEVLDSIRPVIQEENKNSPGHGQLSDDMIRVLPWNTEYRQTDKGTLIRQAFYKQFAAEIDKVYEDSERQTRGELKLSEGELCEFIRGQLKQISLIGAYEISDETDFFAVGCDSLQSLRLRNALLKELDIGSKPLPQNVVFEFPTPAQLARKLYCLRTGEDYSSVPVEQQMKQLIEKYGTFSQHQPLPNAEDGRHVVVTGATGSLGAHVVAQLAADSQVKTIWALVRAENGRSPEQRVLRSLDNRALSDEISLEQGTKIVSLASDLSRDDLGLGERYAVIRERVTDIIHCAWSVNFNKGLSSFENDCIKGTYNLVSLALKAERLQPATLNFCSSVSTAVRTPGGYVPAALPESFSYAQEMGYAQSKLVTEHIITRAAQQTEMKARVLRIGQITADTRHGIWNNTEAIPIMIQAATTMGAIPALDEEHRWLPVDAVAKIVIDVSLANAHEVVFNVVNPKTFNWTSHLIPALHAAGLEFEALPQREWVERLGKSNPDPEANPPIKLLEFFAKKYDDNVVRRAALAYDTRNTERLSPGLSEIGVIGEDQIRRFVEHFRKTSWRKT